MLRLFKISPRDFSTVSFFVEKVDLSHTLLSSFEQPRQQRLRSGMLVVEGMLVGYSPLERPSGKHEGEGECNINSSGAN